jgi:hypothetical protein
MGHPGRISLGRCVNGDPWDDRSSRASLGKGKVVAHAHRTQEGKYIWICVRKPREVLREDSLQVSNTMIDELAHILTGHGHDDVWRRMVRKLGGRVPHNYQKRERKKK